MATHCSILVWKIPWTEEPDTLSKSQKVLTEHTHTHTLVTRQPLNSNPGKFTGSDELLFFPFPLSTLSLQKTLSALAHKLS